MALSEHIRGNIDKMIDEAIDGLPIPPAVKDMLVQRMYESYKQGMKDCMRFIQTYNKQLMEDLDK